MRLTLKQLAIPIALAVGASGAFASVAVARSAGKKNATVIPIASTTPKVLPLIAANMIGTTEVPGPGAADPAYGQALVTVDAVTQEICINIATSGIGAYTALHIHAGEAGVSGPPIVDFAPPAGTTNSYKKCLIDNHASAINTDPTSFYVNVHTADFPAGALRDQLVIRDSEIQYLATPVRAYDSRAVAAGKFANGEIRTVDLSLAGVPIGLGRRSSTSPSPRRSAPATSSPTPTR